jgi:RHS repeat-associated protein
MVSKDAYYPFGMRIEGLSVTGADAQPAPPLGGDPRYKYNSKELDEEKGLNWLAYGARYYDPEIGRWMVVDPAEEFWSGYLGIGNDPINLIDPNGLSTTTDENGKVVDVQNDGDHGVYQWDGENFVYKGETQYWDEFIHYNNDGSMRGMANATIMFDESWDDLISILNQTAIKLGLEDAARESSRFRAFDIKRNSYFAPHGMFTGKLLAGKYASARSAGNYLAGLNGGTARSMIGGITRYSMMKLAGAVHHETFSFKLALRVHILGDKYGPPPYYGEIDYAGRMILKGFSDGRSK